MTFAALSDFRKLAAREIVPGWAVTAQGRLIPAEQRWIWRIRVCAALLIVIQIGFVCFMMKRAYDFAIGEAREHVEEAVRDAEADVNRMIRQFDATLQSLPDLIDLSPRTSSGGGSAAMRRLLFGLAQQNAATRDLYLLDADGALLASAAPTAQGEEMELPRDLLDRLSGQNYSGLQVASPWRNPVTGEVSILLGRRIAQNDLAARYAVAVAAASVLSDRFTIPSSHNDLRVTLIGAGGHLLASQPPDDDGVGRMITDPARLRAANAGVWLGDGLLRAGPAVTGMAVVLNHGLHLVVSVDLDKALAGWRGDLWVALIVVAATAALILTFGRLLSTLVRQRGEAERALIDARDAAEAANRAKSSFLANMSHELRTPLNAIIGFSELIRDRTYGDEAIHRYSAYANDIYASGEHLLALINDILDLSKVEAGAFQLVIEEIEMDAFVMGCLSLFTADACAKGVQLIAPASSGLTIQSDHSALQHVLTNLVSNAIKFTASGGAVTLELAQNEGGGVRLIIADSGVGIAPSTLAKLFEPFQQGSAMVSRRFGGSGLGLSIVRSYTQLLGADIGIESQLGAGTRVTLDLPAVPQTAC